MNTQLLNTLYVQAQGAYLCLQGDTVRIEVEGSLKRQIPLHHLAGLCLFSNVLISPFLLHRCAQDGREVAWYGENGRFQGRLAGPVSGNVLLRRAQYRALENPSTCLYLAARFVEGKLKNARLVLQRAVRERGETEALNQALFEHEAALRQLAQARTVDEVRGLEGQAASAYFAAFGDLLLSGEFRFEGRNKRPPARPGECPTELCVCPAHHPVHRRLGRGGARPPDRLSACPAARSQRLGPGPARGV